MKKIFIALAVCAAFLQSAQAETRSPKKDIVENINTFSAIIKELQTNYVDSIDIEKTVQYGINAMLSNLDPYTEYFPLKEQIEFRAQNSGEYAGIGSYIMARNGYVFISGPHEGSPAARAGLRPGDKILKIDGVDVAGWTTQQVSDKLKGARGTKVNVTVERPYVSDSILTMNIERDKIQIPAVPYYGVVGDDLGYIQLSQFSEKSADEVGNALTDLMTNHGVKGLVLDLRDNPGGYLGSAVKILSYFLPKGTEVLRTRGRDVLEESVYRTTTKPIAPKLPLVILTNGGSASASEITAGALQDLDRAVILGTRSFGKGLVQTTVGLPYNGMLKVTTAKYYIPSGRLIQAIDYSHRSADGSANRIADSLTHVFTTAGGREVRDGGGITPDVKLEYPEVSRLTYNAVAGNWVFDYANKYVATHPAPTSMDDVVVTDEIYADFKATIDPERFNYDRVCEIALADLRKIAKIEGYMSPEVEEQINVLDGLMKHSLEADLDTNRAALTPHLEREIASRYFYDKGEIQATLRHDDMLKEAINLLHDSTRYNSILAPAKR